MKVQIENLKNKQGKIRKISVKVVADDGTKMQRGVFEPNEKRQAKIFADSLRNLEPHLAMPAKVSFDVGFTEYKKDVLKDELKTYESRLNICGYINNHIAPHIHKENLADYTLYDFEKNYIPTLVNSKAMQTKNLPGGKVEVIRSNKKLGKKTIKEAVGNFKLFVRYSLSRKWVIDPTILNFKFNKNFFQDENTKAKWMPKYSDVLAVVNNEKDLFNRTLFHTAAETGVRLNELLGLTYSDIDLKSKPALIYTNHSLDKWNNFRENFLKTASSKRPIEISKSLSIILKQFMKYQTFPKREGKYRMLFGITKNSAKMRIKRAGKRQGIDWRGGMSPFRKFSFSFLRDQQALTDKQIMKRFGWSNMNTPNKWYYKDLDTNKDQRLAAINSMLLDA